MSLEKARAHLARFGMDNRILEFDTSSATVELAAAVVGNPDAISTCIQSD